MFSMRCAGWVVPKRGMKEADCEETHASASCVREQDLCCATFLRAEMIFKLCVKFSDSNRGNFRRKSSGARSWNEVMPPLRRPLQIGAHATNPIPSSLQSGIMRFSASLENKEYSAWMAVIGWTLWARRMFSADNSPRPMWRTIPSATSCATDGEIHWFNRFTMNSAIIRQRLPLQGWSCRTSSITPYRSQTLPN